MRHLVPGLALALLAACHTIEPSAPDTRRVEAEVKVVFDPVFAESLSDEGAQRSVQATATAAALSVADLGLRFYAIPSDAYQKGDPMAPYELTLRMEELGYVVEGHRPEKNGEEIRTLERLRASVSAVLRRRRENGPSLVVGMSQGVAVVTPAEGTEVAVRHVAASYVTTTESASGGALRLLADDVAEVTRRATSEALAKLVEAVDRELAREAGAGDGVVRQ